MSAAPATRRLSLPELEELCAAAVLSAGGSRETAAALARATCAAERRGRSAVGAAHLPDYLDGLCSGRIDGHAVPRLEHRRAAALAVDARGGIAQLAFEHALESFADAARSCGVAVLSMHEAFSAGELGHYAAQMAEQGLIGLACANSPALMAVHGAREAVTGTNPLAFALPHPDGPRVMDQASSATAWVRVRDAARADEQIPAGWALDGTGEPTTDAEEALAGALLPFGGTKGANIALMIEMLAALSGGSFSLDAAPFDRGSRSPRLGLFVLAVDPEAFDPGYAGRLAEHLDRLRREHAAGFGRPRPPITEVELPEDLYRMLRAAQGQEQQR
ncbi:Ldh family oxidoreductase [Brachybacterium sacelli]|uniref:(2R)-3-sulfolactate dehydrogenase (NADP+) n=1 Tax=Brachybacterium sacelli TaxID=173364 RepID=A0ABS4X0L6_9MICO|nr:Ldh family oxidoreductase [Brachybacterium sacelli]MBP2381773.1 (2R)-3-sulfolactate dehydrogenase (NADP+) [Brachybacterium sacelli]